MIPFGSMLIAALAAEAGVGAAAVFCRMPAGGVEIGSIQMIAVCLLCGKHRLRGCGVVHDHALPEPGRNAAGEEKERVNVEAKRD